MKRKALLICSIMLALALISAIKPTQAPSVYSWRWISPIYSGTDTFLGSGEFVAYEAGTDAKLVVQVYNDLSSKAPFKIRVHMDWATENKTSDEKEIQPNQWYTFEVLISVPDTASNLVPHSYRIIVEYVENATVKSLSAITPNGSTSRPYFAVYSADQADSQLLDQEYTKLRNAYSASLLGYWSKTRELLANATVEDYLGDEYYEIGSFSESKTHRETALNYTREAIASDVEASAAFEDALVGIVDAGKSFLSNQGYAYLIASIGFLFIGIGAMVYLIRRSKPPVT